MEWSPRNPSVVAHIDSNGLQFSNFDFTRTAPTLCDSILSNSLTCFKFSPQNSSGYHHGGILLAAGSETNVHLLEYNADQTPRCRAVANLSARRGARCRAVSWSPDGSKLAAGFDKEGGRDNGVVLFDLGSSSPSHRGEFKDVPMAPTCNTSVSEERLPLPTYTTPNKKPSRGGAYGDPAVALAWLPQEDHQLLVGSNKWLRLWDTRQPWDSSSRFLAKQKGAIAGFEVDPLRPNVLATFSDGAHDPVNIFDVRKLTDQSSAPPLAVVLPWSAGGGGGGSGGGGNVTHVAWSQRRAGILATVQSDQSCVSLWDSSPGGHITVPELVYSTPSPCHHIAWAGHGRSVGDDDLLLYVCHPPPRSSHLLSRGNDILGVADLRGFEALAFNSASGVTASATSKSTLCVKSNLADLTNDEIDDADGANDDDDDDVSVVMKARASAGYSTEVGRNLQVLSDEEEEGSACERRQVDVRSSFNMWTWVGRLEQHRTWDISHSGVLSILQGRSSSFESDDPQDDDGMVSEVAMDPTLHCPVFRSAARSTVLGVCGWAFGDNVESQPEAGGSRLGVESCSSALQQVMEESESMGNFERSAALAVFHGDLRAALDALQRSGDHLRFVYSSLADEDESAAAAQGSSTTTQQHSGLAGQQQQQQPSALAMQQHQQQFQHLVAMCLAGFTAPGQASELWTHMCRPLVADERGHPYLRAACAFLLEISENNNASTSSSVSGGGASQRATEGVERYDGALASSSSLAATAEGGTMMMMFAELLSNEALSLDDRTAFAARFLSPPLLKSYCDRETSKALEEGRLEGLLLFGVLSENGQNLLQSYLNRTGDIATVALVACRVTGNEPSTPGTPVSGLVEWIETYRDLLDEWEMWEERASFDVGRSELLRLRRSRDGSAGAASFAVAGEEPGQFVRCNFCSVVIPLVRLVRQADLRNKSWLQGQKPVLSCCPSCRNHLPKCYVCLLSLGSINPYLELKRTGAGGGGGGGGGGKAATKRDSSLDKMSTLNFSSWFTWCQVCKHGGHADHLSSWFESHQVCGVSGCDCRCPSM